MKITLSKGGSNERTLDAKDLELPELPSPADVGTAGCHAILILAHRAVLAGESDPIWFSFDVPDLWHDYLHFSEVRGHQYGKQMLAIWYLAKDLVRILRENFNKSKRQLSKKNAS